MGAGQIAVKALPQSVDDGGVGLQAHVSPQAGGEYLADAVIVTIGAAYVSEPGLFELPDDRNTSEYEFELRRTQDGYWRIADAEWPVDLEHVRDEYCGDEADAQPERDTGASS